MPPRRSVLLKVFSPDETPHSVWLTNDVPKTRADCPTSRHKLGYCGAVRCNKHLWFLAGYERAGRRVEGRTPDATLRHLTWPLPASCSLDIADRVAETGAELEIEDVAMAAGLEHSQIFAIIARGLAKLRAGSIDPDLAGSWPHAVGFSPGD